MERAFAVRESILEGMKKFHCSFLGCKGAGKSTTLVETYYLARSKGMNAIYMDLACEQDSDYHNCTGVGVYFFVDNAQLLRRKEMIAITAMLRQGNTCLAFSSTVFKISSALQDRGDSTFNCPVQTLKCYEFVPFTDLEVQNYIDSNCPGETYSGKTTLPVVVKTCLLGGRTYDYVMGRMLNHMFVKLFGSTVGDDEATLLKLIYTFLHIGNQMSRMSRLKLVSIGLLFDKADDNSELVFERKYIHEKLCQHAHFMKFDIGGAEELQFSDCCHRGQITAVCRGNCYTITGKTPQKSTLTITCTEFLVQNHIHERVTVSSGPTCCLIKLAINHPAIDFIIYESKGPVGTRVLYFIQVSASNYQNRVKKLSAVTDLSSELGNESPYKYYRAMFKVNSAEVFYIYSSPTPVPLTAAFSTDKRDKNRVYFHQLGY